MHCFLHVTAAGEEKWKWWWELAGMGPVTSSGHCILWAFSSHQRVALLWCSLGKKKKTIYILISPKWWKFKCGSVFSLHASCRAGGEGASPDPGSANLAGTGEASAAPGQEAQPWSPACPPALEIGSQCHRGCTFHFPFPKRSVFKWDLFHRQVLHLQKAKLQHCALRLLKIFLGHQVWLFGICHLFINQVTLFNFIGIFWCLWTGQVWK